MRKIIALLLLAATADAAPWIKDGLWFDRIPNPLPMGNGFAKFDPSEADFIATGARLPTQEEIDARSAAQAEAEEQQAAAATLPLMNASGFAATNEAGHWVKFVPDGTNAVSETLAIQISHSPPDPQTAAQMEADAIEAHEAKKAANRAKIGEAKAKAAAANSVPALRAAVAKIIEALEE
jgi:hypothetical protein